MISLFDMREKIAEKGKKCWLPAFFRLPTMFSKGFFFRVIKSRDGVLGLKCF